MGSQKFGETSDQKKMLNKMKHDLEGCRELILHLNSVLKWEKKFYPGLIFGFSTILFLVLWYLDLSTMTMGALILLCASVLDIALPVVSKFIFKPENWTGDNENQFESVCEEVCVAKLAICNGLSHVFASKETKSSVSSIVTVCVLIVLAYIGAVIDNLLLSYLGFLILMLYPGLLHHGIVNMVKEK
ncbi:ADP-ribosylation factor-like protein 6-interacting protein 1, partial [Pseudolycoriella hygida]